jgi:hypothetical protein
VSKYRQAFGTSPGRHHVLANLPPRQPEPHRRCLPYSPPLIHIRRARLRVSRSRTARRRSRCPGSLRRQRRIASRARQTATPTASTASPTQTCVFMSGSVQRTAHSHNAAVSSGLLRLLRAQAPDHAVVRTHGYGYDRSYQVGMVQEVLLGQHGRSGGSLVVTLSFDGERRSGVSVGQFVGSRAVDLVLAALRWRGDQTFSASGISSTSKPSANRDISSFDDRFAPGDFLAQG